jgi:hypothetical protein
MLDLVRFDRRSHETHSTLQGRRRLGHLLSCDDNISRLAGAVRAQNAPGKIRGSPSEGVRNVSLNTQSVGQDVRRTVGLVNPPGFTSAGLSVATGIAFNQNGDLLISDLSRKAIWKVEFNPDGSLKSPIGCDTTYHPKTLCLSNVFIQHPLLGAQIALDTFGNIWSGVPDRNAIAVVTTCGNVEEIFRNPVNSFHRRNAADTDNTRILEFPNSPVLLDKRFCVSNFDEDIQDNSPNIAGELNPIAGPRGKISCMDQDLYVPGIPLPVK